MPKIPCVRFFILFSLNIILTDTFSPVILVPGDGGSQLEAKLNKTSTVHYYCEKTSDFFNIWLNLEQLMPLVIDCWIDNTKLIYNFTTRTTSPPQGVEIRVPGWGQTEPVEWLDPSHRSVGNYFKDIAEVLVSIGYVRNVSIRGAPYDFRKAPNENTKFFIDLKHLVEETFTQNNNTPVTLLAHSMGGTMSLRFLQMQTKSWKDKYISKMITLSSPWGGAMKALKVFCIGDDLGTYFLRSSVLKQEQITCPSLSWLLPSPLFWKEHEVLVQTDKYNYTIKDLEKFFFDLDYPIGWEMRKDTIEYSQNFEAPEVEVHCLYGTNVSTVEKLVYPPGKWLDGYPNLVTGNGDGTVNLRSLTACAHWRTRKHHKSHVTLNDNRKIKTLDIPDADHLSMLHDKRVLDYIKTVMSL